MCSEILVIRGEKRTYCETVGELAEALHLNPAQVSADAAYCCLCNARLDELKARRATPEEGDPWPEYIIELPA